MLDSDLMFDTRGADWTVFRAHIDGPATILAGLCGALFGSLFWLAAAMDLAGTRGSQEGRVLGGLVLFATGVAAFGASYLGLVYFVALDERYLTVGRVRRSSDQTVERHSVARVVWKRKDPRAHAILCAADGSVLLHVGWEMSRTQMARVAEYLGVPFVPAPE